MVWKNSDADDFLKKHSSVLDVNTKSSDAEIRAFKADYDNIAKSWNEQAAYNPGHANFDPTFDYAALGRIVGGTLGGEFGKSEKYRNFVNSEQKAKQLRDAPAEAEARYQAWVNDPATKAKYTGNLSGSGGRYLYDLKHGGYEVAQKKVDDAVAEQHAIGDARHAKARGQILGATALALAAPLGLSIAGGLAGGVGAAGTGISTGAATAGTSGASAGLLGAGAKGAAIKGAIVGGASGALRGGGIKGALTGAALGAVTGVAGNAISGGLGVTSTIGKQAVSGAVSAASKGLVGAVGGNGRELLDENDKAITPSSGVPYKQDQFNGDGSAVTIGQSPQEQPSVNGLVPITTRANQPQSFNSINSNAYRGSRYANF